ncbi:MAG: orotate phosphoribosyltransferase [Actinomycetaceae bacterium]|nr:orotate phosphoribosyltransferase [Actinomycetaceae bacterium]MDY6083594.1 orotate phosphoribosyltransferase [Actinomycetaceae bacterium]
MENLSARSVAGALLDIGAVFVRPDQPFTWVSGIHSPIYTDNRLVLTAPEVRKGIEDTLAAMIAREFADAEVLMGTATAGIPHAALAAERLGLPMGYVRGEAKDHGRGNRIEGKLQAGQRVVVVEDLISTGGSVLATVAALRDAGAQVLGVAALFTYGMQAAKDTFHAASVPLHTLTTFDDAIEEAAARGQISEEDLPRLRAFRDNPHDESWMK